MTHAYLALDLGAESGRAILARLRDGLLDITEVARSSVHWDVLRLRHEMQRALAEVDVGQPLSGCSRASARRAPCADNTNS